MEPAEHTTPEAATAIDPSNAMVVQAEWAASDQELKRKNDQRVASANYRAKRKAQSADVRNDYESLKDQVKAGIASLLPFLNGSRESDDVAAVCTAAAVKLTESTASIDALAEANAALRHSSHRDRTVPVPTILKDCVDAFSNMDLVARMALGAITPVAGTVMTSTVPPTKAGVHFISGGAVEVYLRGDEDAASRECTFGDWCSNMDMHSLQRACPEESRDDMQLACTWLATARRQFKERAMQFAREQEPLQVFSFSDEALLISSGEQPFHVDVGVGSYQCLLYATDTHSTVVCTHPMPLGEEVLRDLGYSKTTVAQHEDAALLGEYINARHVCAAP